MDRWHGWQSALLPAGPQAARELTLFHAMLGMAALVTLLVLVMLAFAVVRARRREARGEAVPPDAERTMTRAIGVAVAASAVILLAFLGISFASGRAMATEPGQAPITINVVGHQWWWEFRYEDTLPSNRLTVANELHLPVGRPVRFKITSSDVIHSFWAPNFAGKKDGIPGHVAHSWFRADTVGTYRGVCAEFCGYQHAKMAFVIVAEPPGDYERWYAEQLAPAAQPVEPSRRHGQDVFLANGCIMCHSIRGTPAGSSIGPDLTHIGSSLTLAAGTLPNTRGNLAGWILDPQGIKPGSHMPPNQLEARDLQALLDYLEGLK